MMSQQDEIDRLTEELQMLKDAVRYLAHCKVTADEYMFYDWVVKNEVFGNKRIRLDRTLLILGTRLAGEEIMKQQEIPGVPGELLYKDGPPTYDDAKVVLMAALDVNAEAIVDGLFEALRLQGIHKQLAGLALKSAG